MSTSLKQLVKGSVEERLAILEKVVDMMNEKTAFPGRIKNVERTPEDRLASVERHVYGMAKLMREILDLEEENKAASKRSAEILEKLFHAQSALSLIRSFKEKMAGRNADISWARKAIEPAVKYFEQHKDKQISPGPDARLVAV